jgi:hypothetical protein
VILSRLGLRSNLQRTPRFITHARTAPSHISHYACNHSSTVSATHMHWQEGPAKLFKLQEVDIIEGACAVRAPKEVQAPAVLRRAQRGALSGNRQVAKAGDECPVQRVLVVDPQVVQEGPVG